MQSNHRRLAPAAVSDSQGATTRAPTDSWRKFALAGGVFYLLTFVFSIAAFFLYEPVLIDPTYIVGVGGSDNQVILGGIFEMLCALAGIGTAVALYPVIRRQSAAASLGFVTTRVFEAAVMMIGVLALLAIVSMRQAGAAPGTDPAATIAVGQMLVAIRDQAAYLGPGFVPVLNALLLGYVLYRSRLIPRIIPALGLIGAPLLFASLMGRMFGLLDETSAFAAIALAPVYFWELSVGVWLTLKGFNPSAAILADPASTVGADPSSRRIGPAAADAGAA
jgi:hypothetical protein